MEESNKEKFLKLVSGKKSGVMDDIRWRIENREWLRESRQIALFILSRLDELGWSKRDLADRMGVTVREVSKWVSGSYRFDVELLDRLRAEGILLD